MTPVDVKPRIYISKEYTLVKKDISFNNWIDECIVLIV